MHYNKETKLTQGEQIRLILPLLVVVVGGVIFVRFEHGRQFALLYAEIMVPVLIAAALLGRFLSRRAVVRLNQIRRAGERLEQGYYDLLPMDHTDDEYDDIARAFNHMIEIAAGRDQAQREYTDALANVYRRMEMVLDATNDGIALIDGSARFLLANRRFCEMLGTDSESLLDQRLSDIQPIVTGRFAHPDRLMNLLTPLTEQDLIDPTSVTQDVIEVSSGEQRFFQVYTAPVSGAHAGESGRIIALHDITRETEVDKMKTEFISVVSHELRTPLTSIKGYTDLLLSEEAGEINELQREFLGILQSSSTRLNNLINDMLDISRLESGRIDVKAERVDYEQIVADTLRLMKAAADEKEQSFDASFPAHWPPVRGDADKITQVLTNLLSNAIKYTPRGGWIKLSLELSGASVTTCIADSGIGISAEDQKKLFQKFFRADNSSTREAGGTGLGLAIVKMIVELLGGAIWLESETNKGSRFYFTLPLYNELSSEDGQSVAENGADIEIGHDEIARAMAQVDQDGNS